MKSLILSLFAYSALVGCATFGPKANVTLQKSEIKTTKEVGNIIVSGVGGAFDPAGLVDKAVATSAIAAYGSRARPVEPVKMLLGKIKLDAMADLLTAPYQAEFAKVIDAYTANGTKKKRPKSMKLPSTELEEIKIPEDFTDLKQLQAMAKGTQFKALQKEMDDVVTELKKPGPASGKIIKALAASKTLQGFLAKTDSALFDSLEADHILLTYVAGDEAAFNSGKEVSMYSALVNLKTGKFRYFAESKVKKGMTPYNVQMGLMASSVFGAASDKDPLPDAKDKDLKEKPSQDSDEDLAAS